MKKRAGEDDQIYRQWPVPRPIASAPSKSVSMGRQESRWFCDDGANCASIAVLGTQARAKSRPGVANCHRRTLFPTE